MEIFEKTILLFSLLLSISPQPAITGQVLKFQAGSAGSYSTSEWAELKVPLPPLAEFTVCHWEKLLFFSVRDSCQWAACYKLADSPVDHHCTQFWYNRDAGSGGRYVRAAGGFGDNSYGGNLAYHTAQSLTVTCRNIDEELQASIMEPHLLDIP